MLISNAIKKSLNGPCYKKKDAVRQKDYRSNGREILLRIYWSTNTFRVLFSPRFKRGEQKFIEVLRLRIKFREKKVF